MYVNVIDNNGQKQTYENATVLGIRNGQVLVEQSATDSNTRSIHVLDLTSVDLLFVDDTNGPYENSHMAFAIEATDA